MPNRKPLEDLFSETLKDIYFAEKQILRALPKMAKEAWSPELKQVFEAHRDQTEGHVERLNEVFEQLGKPARGKTCEAILGIIDEAKEIMEDFKGAEALDAGLASSAHPLRRPKDLGVGGMGCLRAPYRHLRRPCDHGIRQGRQSARILIAQGRRPRN
jgi:hypothetical protein